MWIFLLSELGLNSVQHRSNGKNKSFGIFSAFPRTARVVVRVLDRVYLDLYRKGYRRGSKSEERICVTTSCRRHRPGSAYSMRNFPGGGFHFLSESASDAAAPIFPKSDQRDVQLKYGGFLMQIPSTFQQKTCQANWNLSILVGNGFHEKIRRSEVIRLKL